MKVEKGKVVFIHYTVKNKNGNIIDTSIGVDPLGYVHGDATLINGLQMALEGQKKGDKFITTIEPMDAYGAYNKALVQQINRSDFDGVSFEEGEDVEIELETESGPEMGFAKVIKIESDCVTLDFNHPLAGETLVVDAEVIEVRNLTPEEADTGHIMGQPIPESQ